MTILKRTWSIIVTATVEAADWQEAEEAMLAMTPNASFTVGDRVVRLVQGPASILYGNVLDDGGQTAKQLLVKLPRPHYEED